MARLLNLCQVTVLPPTLPPHSANVPDGDGPSAAS